MAGAGRSGNGTRRIGLVEDSDTDAYAFSRAFSRLGRVERWSTVEAFRDAYLDDPDLIASLSLLMVDLNLPGADGVAAIRGARATPAGRELPIVMLTGSTAQHDELRARHATADAFEVKPPNLVELHALVARCGELLRTREDADAPSADAA